MKDNKADGIPKKLLKEIVQKISAPLAKVFNYKCSLEDGIVPSEWKEANIFYYLKLFIKLLLLNCYY